ncbi:hypothetical protein NQ318_022387 [Aromia moschata]|uniref:Uncharacterized protein n=1 Tax=Aromia moschata TaxID=1265417 RepID=A0AAV8Z4P5_9CUCU|nr:hypothetical protein NQ318_022387 [Aromia moschata]
MPVRGGYNASPTGKFQAAGRHEVFCYTTDRNSRVSRSRKATVTRWKSFCSCMYFLCLQHVDEENSYLCGYLQINGLTDEYPKLTTFFDGEIISQKYPFLTRKWDADEDVDKKHWSKFSLFSQYAKTLNSDTFDYKALSGYGLRVHAVERTLLGT